MFRSPIIHGSRVVRSTSHPLTRLAFKTKYNAFPTIGMSSKRFNSSSSTTESAVQATSDFKQQLPSFDSISDTASTLGQQIIGEASTHYGYLQSVGLAKTWWWPPDFIQHCLEIVHVTTGLPWWATIALTTVAVRSLLFPIYVKSSDMMARNSKIKPQLDVIQAEIYSATDMSESQQAMLKRKKLLAEHGIKNRYLAAPALQLPLALGFFAGIRHMTNYPVDGFQNQGILWFQDLTATDPYLGLQCLSAAVIIGFMRLGGETGAQTISPQMMKFFTIMPLISIPLTSGLSSGVVLYFFVNGLFSVFQSMILKNKAFRKRFNIAEIVPPPKPDPNAPQLSMIDSFKKSMKDARDKAEKRALANQKTKEEQDKVFKMKQNSHIKIVRESDFGKNHKK